MHAVLEPVVNQIANQLNGLDAETAQLHPRGLSHLWSPQQVIEHLVLGYRLTTGSLETRLKKGRASRHLGRTYLQRSLQLMILSFGVLPEGMPPLEATVPVRGQFPAMDGGQLEELLRREIQTMDSALDACRHRFGMERVAAHPWLGGLRVDQWRRFHVVHGLHQAAQLRSVLEQVAAVRVPVRITNKNLVKELQIPAQRPLA
jgi:hypothetical protein